MIIIGERINSTRSAVKEAIKNRNASFIGNQARLQIESGADFIDINCAVTSGDEVQDIDWVVSVIQSAIKDVSICVDSPNHLAIERALQAYKADGSVMINSITAEEARIETIVPLAVKYKAKLIALTMDENGMPDTAQKRLDIAKNILENVAGKGIDPENLYFDPLIRPISTEPEQPREVLEAIPLIKKLPGVKTVCGLSNISFGLPRRSVINSVFLSMAIHAGLDAAILDILDKNILSALKASMALSGMDSYCGEYIKAFREGRLV